MSPILTVVETRPGHIHQIVTSPSDITRREMERAGLTPWQLLKSLNELLKIGQADTLRIDSWPSLVFGHNPVPGGGTRRVTWFVASQRYFDLGPRGVVYARNYMRRFHSVWPGTAFDSYSYSDHPDLKRWFEALGFQRNYAYDVPAGCAKFTFTAKTPEKPKKGDSAKVS